MASLLRSKVPLEAILRAAPMSAGPAVVAEGVRGARLEGFSILAEAQMPLSAGIVLTDSDVAVENNQVAGTGVGIEVNGSASPAIGGNAIHDCTAEGILILGPSAPWVWHNSIQRNKGAGLAARDGARPALAGNVFEKNAVELPPEISMEDVRQHNFFLDAARAPAARPAQGPRRPGPRGERNAGDREMIAPAGRHLGKYEIRQKLGRGGMADVYLADDTALGHAVALKLIEHSADADTRDAIEAERRGARLQASLADIDTHVVAVYDFGDLDGYFYVAMEYVDGQDLAELMRRGPLAVEFAADAAVAVAETLEHAHALEVTIEGKNFQGIVHGDIKPKNIRVDARGNVRVLDFGIAKALSLSRRLTRNEFGSVPYASPERLDLGEVNALSDLWSLAVMLYEMVTGLQPYQADNTERLERMIRSRIPPPPAPDPCPEPLRRILIKAMAPEPDLRYQCARDLADDLIAFRLGAPVKAVAEDLDATRRTFPRETGDETRRTGASDQATRKTGPATAVAPMAAADGQAPRQVLPGRPARRGRACAPGARLGPVRHGLGLLPLPARPAVRARDPDRAAHRSGPDMVAMDSTFQEQSLVFPVARAAPAGQGEARRSGRSRDCHLSRQRSPAGL